MQWDPFLFFQNDCITKKSDFDSARFQDVKRHEKAPKYGGIGTKKRQNRAVFFGVGQLKRQISREIIPTCAHVPGVSHLPFYIFAYNIGIFFHFDTSFILYSNTICNNSLGIYTPFIVVQIREYILYLYITNENGIKLIYKSDYVFTHINKYLIYHITIHITIRNGSSTACNSVQ